MIRTPKKNLVVIYRDKGGLIRDKEEEQLENCCKIFLAILMTLVFCAIKISCFIMICKFVFQEEENMFGFSWNIFSFQKTYWSFQYPLLNDTSVTTTEYNDGD